MSSKAYLKAAAGVIDRITRTQGKAIGRAASLIERAITGNKTVFSFGASHSFMLTEELVYRSGGLMLVNPIYPHGMNISVRPMTLTSRIERIPGLGAELLNASPAGKGDVLILASVSGRNAVIVDMAQAAGKKGIATIAVTSSAYSGSVASRHTSGKKLADLCDVVVDNCVPRGDAAVKIRGLRQKVGPLSSVAGVAVVNAIVCEVAARLARKGITPPVFMSANLDGGDEWNARLLAKNRRRIHYM